LASKSTDGDGDTAMEKEKSLATARLRRLYSCARESAIADQAATGLAMKAPFGLAANRFLVDGGFDGCSPFHFFMAIAFSSRVQCPFWAAVDGNPQHRRSQPVRGSHEPAPTIFEEKRSGDCPLSYLGDQSDPLFAAVRNWYFIITSSASSKPSQLGFARTTQCRLAPSSKLAGHVIDITTSVVAGARAGRSFTLMQELLISVVSPDPRWISSLSLSALYEKASCTG
jgi:hypothetical protein